MPRYIFRAPIDSTDSLVEVHVDGDSLDDAVENYMNDEGVAREYLDYTIDTNEVVGIGYTDNGNFVAL